MRQCENCFEYYDEFADSSCPCCGYQAEQEKEEKPGHLKVGSQLQLGRYRIGKCLGQGSFGITYLAWDENQSIKAAIKEFYPSHRVTRGSGSQVIMLNASDADRYQLGKKQFQEEANKLARFHDIPEIVSVTECFEENATVYIVMKYIEGENLEQYLQKYEEKMGIGSFPSDQAVKLLLPVMRAMKVVNDNQTYHLDIAPDNIMITGEEKAVLIDFGIAKNLFGESEDECAYKQGYSPIEQYNKAEPTASTDVYAMAATLYRMLTGKAPADSRLRLQACQHKKKDCLEPIEKLRPDVSENIQTAIHNGLNLLPVNRTADMQELIWELTAPVPIERKKEKWKRIDLSDWPLWGKVLIGAGTAGIVAFSVLFGTGIIGFRSGLENKIILEEGKTRVPSMINRTVSIAGQSANASDLDYVITGKEYSYAVPKNYVMSQSIHPGTVVDARTKIELVVSAGGEPVLLPSLEGSKEEEAVWRLETLGVSPVVVRVETDAMEPGVVLGFSGLEYESYAEKGSEVVLCVAAEPTPEPSFEDNSLPGDNQGAQDATSSPVSVQSASGSGSTGIALEGNSPENTAKESSAAPSQGTADRPANEVSESASQTEPEIPDLVGKQLIDAIEVLKGEKQLQLKVEQKKYSDRPAGIIIEQRTEKADKKTIIYVTLSMGTERIWIPDVTMLQEAEAAAGLEEIGFKAEVTGREYDDELAKGLVIDQSPKGNTYGTNGEQINLIVSLGKAPEEIKGTEAAESEGKSEEEQSRPWEEEITEAEENSEEELNRPEEKEPTEAEKASEEEPDRLGEEEPTEAENVSEEEPDWLREEGTEEAEKVSEDGPDWTAEPEMTEGEFSSYDEPDWLTEPEMTEAEPSSYDELGWLTEPETGIGEEEAGSVSGSNPILGVEKDGVVYTYEIVSGDHAVLKSCSTQEEEVFLESDAEGYPVTEIADGAFDGCISVRHLILSESIVKLGDSLFGSQEEAIEVTVLGKVTVIGNMPFPQGSQILVTDEESQVIFSFYYDSVSTVIERTEEEEAAASTSETGINPTFDLVIGNTIFTYKTEANQNAVLTKCNSWEEKEKVDAYVQGHLISGITDFAFSDCYNMKRLRIGEGITSIGSNLFGRDYWDTELQIMVPSSVTEIGVMPFPWNAIVIAPDGSYAVSELSRQGYDVRVGTDFIETESSLQESKEPWVETMAPSEPADTAESYGEPETESFPEMTMEAYSQNDQGDIDIYDTLVSNGIYAADNRQNPGQYIAGNQSRLAWLVPLEDGKRWAIYMADQSDPDQGSYAADCTETTIHMTDFEFLYIRDGGLMRMELSDRTEENILEQYDIRCIDFCLKDEAVLFVGRNTSNEIGLYQYIRENGEGNISLLWSFEGEEIPELDLITDQYLYYRYQGQYYYYDRTMEMAVILSDKPLYARNGYFFFLEKGMLWRTEADGSGRIFILYASNMDEISFADDSLYYLSEEQEGQSLIQYDMYGNLLYQWEQTSVLKEWNVLEDWLYDAENGALSLLTRE